MVVLNTRFGGDYIAGPLLIFWGAYRVVGWLSLLLHEGGHMLAAKLVGDRVQYLELGGKTSFKTFKAFGLPVRLGNDLPNRGAVYRTFGPRKSPLRRIAVSAAGPAADLVMLALWLAVAAWIDQPSEIVGPILLGGMAAHATSAAITLWPHTYRDGLDSDGLTILKILRQGRRQAAEEPHGPLHDLVASVERFQAGDNEGAIDAAASAWRDGYRTPESLQWLLHVHGEGRAPAEAVAAYRLRSADVPLGEQKWAAAYAGIGWYALRSGDHPLAEDMAHMALEADPDDKFARLTTGAVAISVGAFEMGLELAGPAARELEPIDKALACDWLARGEAGLGREEKARELSALGAHFAAQSARPAA